MRRTVIYLRVSTSRQAEEGDSIPTQRDALRKYIDDHDDMVYAGEYMDDGVSGTKIDRDELQHLLDDVRAGRIDLILVTKLDRWFRSIRHYINTQETLDRYGVGWLAIWEPIYDSTTPQGRLIINQMMSIAQFEAENTSQRIRQVFDHKKANGEVTNGKIPFGYTVVDKHLVPGPDAESARRIFEFFAQTGRIADTVRYASALGYSVDRSQLKNTLQNTRYIGEFAGNPAYCAPIIDRDLWDRVRYQLRAGTKNNTDRIYLFSGLIICAECGLKYATCHVSGAVVYRCQGKYCRVIKICDNTRTIRESVLERYLVENITALVAGDSAGVEAERRKAEDSTRQIAAIERKIARLKDLYLNELITMDEYKADKERYTEELSKLSIPKPVRDFERITRLIGDDFQGRYWTWDKTERRNFWRSIIDRITIDKSRKIAVSFL